MSAEERDKILQDITRTEDELRRRHAEIKDEFTKQSKMQTVRHAF
jgi:hypothetical protein